MTIRVLVSCPNMLARMDVHLDEMRRLGWDVDTPDVTQQLSERDLLSMIRDYDAVIAGDDEFTAAVIEEGAKHRLRTIAKWGVGLDNIDRGAATRAGITVTNTPGVFGNEVADVVIGYLVLLSRQLHRIDAAVRRGEWMKPVGSSLTGRTVAILGLGSIGCSVIPRARAMGMLVIGHDPQPEAAARARELGADVVSIDELVARADYTVLCCPLTPATRHIINASRLQDMRATSALINVSRGPLVDSAALVQALTGGDIAGAALDVFEEEPLPVNHPLCRLDNVILGSHNASNTLEAVDRVSRLAIHNVQRALDDGAAA